MSQSVLAKAIRERKPVQFTYIKPGKSQGLRIGNPHAIFVFTSKAGVKSVKVHIAQTGGASDSATPFPSFRLFDVTDIVVQSIRYDDPVFEMHPDYNPHWEGYSDAIEKL